MVPGLGYVCAMDWPGFAAGFEVGRTGMLQGDAGLEDPAVAARDRNLQKLERLLQFDVTPREIAAYLEEYVIGRRMPSGRRLWRSTTIIARVRFGTSR